MVGHLNKNYQLFIKLICATHGFKIKLYFEMLTDSHAAVRDKREAPCPLHRLPPVAALPRDERSSDFKASGWRFLDPRVVL